MPLGSSLDVGIQRTLDLPVLELQSSHASVEDVQCDLRSNRGGIPSESEECPVS